MDSLLGRVVLGVVIVLIAWGVIAFFIRQVETVPPLDTSSATTTSSQTGLGQGATTTGGTGGSGILPYDSGVRGQVLLGPTCPVERMPPDPECAGKPYATGISVYRAGAGTPFVQGKSDATGYFQFSLPPGEYVLRARGGAVMPTCSEIAVTVQASEYVSVTVSCDTGIR